MTTEELWSRWAARPAAMTPADRTDFKEQWKLHRHPKSCSCAQCLNGEIICRYLAKEAVRESEKQVRDLQEWASSQIVPWQALQKEDYDFRSWVSKMTGKQRRIL